MDDLHQFMQDCCQLKQWLKDDQEDRVRSEVEPFVRSFSSLMIAVGLGERGEAFRS